MDKEIFPERIDVCLQSSLSGLDDIMEANKRMMNLISSIRCHYRMIFLDDAEASKMARLPCIIDRGGSYGIREVQALIDFKSQRERYLRQQQ